MNSERVSYRCARERWSCLRSGFSACRGSSRNPAAICRLLLFSDVADVRQHFLAEQFERFHQLIGIFRARGLERQIDDAGAYLVAALLQLRDYLVRPTAEIDRQHPVDIGWPPPLASDVALIEFQQRGADPGLQREHRLPRILCQHLLRLLAGLGDQDVGAVDDLVRLRLPTVARALFLVVAGHLAHCVEWAERHAEADMVPRRKVAGLAAGAEGIHRRQRLLQRLWPDRKSTRLNSSHLVISYAVFCLKKKIAPQYQFAFWRSVRDANSCEAL